VRAEELLSDHAEEKGSTWCLLILVVWRFRRSTAEEERRSKRSDNAAPTTSLSSRVDARPFTIAKDFRAMKPSEARNLWAEVISSCDGGLLSESQRQAGSEVRTSKPPGEEMTRQSGSRRRGSLDFLLSLRFLMFDVK
jgi:hypothetical protein